MKNIDFELGRLAGILDTFALLNTKTNHDYSFEIVSLQVCEQSQMAFQNYFLEIYPEASITLEELSIADLKVRDVLREWLFSYQKSDDMNEKFIGSGSGLYMINIGIFILLILMYKLITYKQYLKR